MINNQATHAQCAVNRIVPLFQFISFVFFWLLCVLCTIQCFGLTLFTYECVCVLGDFGGRSFVSEVENRITWCRSQCSCNVRRPVLRGFYEPNILLSNVYYFSTFFHSECRTTVCAGFVCKIALHPCSMSRI